MPGYRQELQNSDSTEYPTGKLGSGWRLGLVRMMLPVTVRVQKHQIRPVIPAPIRPLDLVMNVPSRSLRDRLVAHGAQAILPPPQIAQLVAPVQRSLHLAAKPQ